MSALLFLRPTAMEGPSEHHDWKTTFGRMELHLQAAAPSSSETTIEFWLHHKMNIILPCPEKDEEDHHYVYVIQNEIRPYHCCSTLDGFSSQLLPSAFDSLVPKILAFARGCGAARVVATANLVTSLSHKFVDYFANHLKSSGTQIPCRDSRRVTCSICLEEVAGELMEKMTLPCSHAFHRGCIFRWLSKKNSCPMCRYNLRRYKPQSPSACTTV